MKDYPPNNETGPTDNRAHSKNIDDAKRLTEQLRKINNAAPHIWTGEGWRLLSEYQRTGDHRHLKACVAHVAAIRERITNGLTEGDQ